MIGMPAHISSSGMRVISAVWSVWAWLTSMAYGGTEPGQLEPIMVWLPVNLAHAWGLVAVLMTIGALLPAISWLGAVARWCRTLGMIISAALLAAFAASFVMAGGRGWVSAKNYAALALASLACSHIFGRDHGRQVLQ